MMDDDMIVNQATKYKLANTLSQSHNKKKVAIIAPASGIRDNQGKMDVAACTAYLEYMVRMFQDHGFSCKYDERIFTHDELPYFAAPRMQRIKQLRDSIEDPEVEIIAMLRGGYGSGEIVFDCMNLNLSSPKIFIGFSDGTALHFLFNQHYNLPSIHGIVSERYHHNSGGIFKILKGKTVELALKNMNQHVSSTGIDQDIQGQVTGGNLSLVCNMISTKMHPSAQGKILVLEDVGEHGYKVHRYLLHLYNSHVLSGVAAIVFGDFTSGDELVEISIENFIGGYLSKVPVFRAVGIGHGANNLPFVMGTLGVIKDNKLIIKSPFRCAV